MDRSFNVEWFNVSYRSIVLALLVGGGVLGGGGGWWLYTGHVAPRREASAALTRADGRLAEAAKRLDDERVDELVTNARAALDSAREQFGARDYDGALVTAIRSENFSLRALSLAEDAQGEAHAVQIEDVDGDVRLKLAGEFSWKAAERGMVLHIGDQLKTSSRGKAKLLYFDGTESVIESGSLLEIRDLYEDPVTKVRRVQEKLNRGELQASTRKRNVGGSYHEVETETAALRAEDAGKFRVVFDEQRRSSVVDVFDGRVEISTASRKDTVAAGERMEARRDGSLSPRESLPGTPRLQAPADQRVFVSEDPARQSLTLSWEAVPGATRYRLMIADRPLFAAPLYDASRDGVHAVVEGIASGSYHWRVAAVSPDGVEGPFSEVRAFRVSSERIRDRADRDPPRLEVTEFVAVGQMVVINGETEPGAMLWIDDNKVELFGDGSFNAVVRLRREGKNEVVLVAQDNAGNETTVRRTAFVEIY